MAPRRAAAVSAANNLAAAAAQSRVASSSANPVGKQLEKASAAAKKENVSGSASTSTQTDRPPAPAIPISPIVERLRKTWKFAAICQFLFTFDEAFGMSGFESEALERDLDGSETQVIPDLMRRLLYTLTLNRSIGEENWESHLRSQYLKREPEEPLLGTLEEPQSWHALPLMQKVGSIHQLCEWQLCDAERFRKLVKNEDDAQVWRIDPIGWDAHDNTYWLFDDNRLWIQHPPPPPPLAKAPPKKSSKKAKAEARREALKRKREASAGTSKVGAATPSRPRKQLAIETPLRSSPRNRTSSDGMPSGPTRQRPTRGRRTEEWEEIPPELLFAGTDESKSAKHGDDDSELSDPPDEEVADETIESTTQAEQEQIKAEIADDTVMNVDEKQEDDESISQSDVFHVNGRNSSTHVEPPKEDDETWIEFEALAITQSDWEWMSSRFAKSKHPDEKGLHQLLKETVLPKIMADLAEAEKQRLHEMAMANRKRSSRIALKESEREERERDRIARQRMEEKMTAIREEEEEQLRREREEKDAVRVREERLREREERLLAREREAMDRALREAEDRENREKMRELRKMKREQIIANGGHPPDDDSALDSMATTPAPGAAEDSWKLDCEICGRHGINLEETGEIVCCEQCGEWQHIRCWDAFDRRCDRPPRDWEKEDFYCSRCHPPPAGQPRPENRRDRQPTKQQNGDSHAESVKAPEVQPQRPAAQTNHLFGGQLPSQAYPENTPSRGSVQSQSVPPVYNAQPVRPTHSQTPPFVAPQQLPNSAIAYQQQKEAPPIAHHYAQHNPVVGGQALQYPSGFFQSGPYQGQQAPQQHWSSQSYNHLPMQQPMRTAPQQAQQIPHQLQQQPRPQAIQTPKGTIAASQNPHSASAGGNVASQPYTSTTQPASSSSAAAAAISPQSAVTPQRPSPSGPSPSVSPATLHNGLPPVPSATTQAPSPARQGGSVHGAPSSTPAYSNGSMNATNSSAVPGIGAGANTKAPSPQHQAAMRSPTSIVPRSMANQPSGSFPMRYASARSPLSGPPQSPLSSTAGLPSVSLGPPARSSSPSPMSKQNVMAARPPQLEHALLHGRQTPQSPQSQAEARGATIPATGPGPSSGTLTRSSDVSDKIAASQQALARQALPSSSSSAASSLPVSAPPQHYSATGAVAPSAPLPTTTLPSTTSMGKDGNQ